MPPVLPCAVAGVVGALYDPTCVVAREFGVRGGLCTALAFIVGVRGDRWALFLRRAAALLRFGFTLWFRCSGTDGSNTVFLGVVRAALGWTTNPFASEGNTNSGTGFLATGLLSTLMEDTEDSLELLSEDLPSLFPFELSSLSDGRSLRLLAVIIQRSARNYQVSAKKASKFSLFLPAPFLACFFLEHFLNLFGLVVFTSPSPSDSQLA